MTVRLTVRRADWLRHVHDTATAYGPDLVPVVKGNGYGFGRPALHDLARDFAGEVCVGTMHELADVPAEMTPIVLTPTLQVPDTTRPLLTVGHPTHARALHGWQGRVFVKLASTMRRHGVLPDELPALSAEIEAAGPTVAGYALHLPLAGDDTARLAEVEAWLPHLPRGASLWVSHLSPASYTALTDRHPERPFRIRVGTALWHGRPKGPFLHLSADVLDTHPIRAGEPAGYFHTPAPHDGTLLVVGAGSAHGVAPLDSTDRSARSPFHFAQRRLTLLETPHMHASMVIADHGAPVPEVGDRVDVQRPLTTTSVDEVEWV